MTSCPSCGGKVLYQGLTSVECASPKHGPCPNGVGVAPARQGLPPVFALSIGKKIQHVNGEICTIVDVRSRRTGSVVTLAGRRELACFPEEREDWWPV